MKEGAFVKLPRELLYSHYYSDPVMLKIYITLLLLARFYPERIYGVDVKEGQLLITKNELAQRLKIPERKLRYALDKFRADELISTENIRNQFTLITVNYYMSYISTAQLLSGEKEKC